MAYADYKHLLNEARERFINGEYGTAERLLQQVLLMDSRLPEVYQILATIAYDQGKFSKAIKLFQKALEIDPAYTDASVGLSIILNDLGRYEEGKKIFQEAQKVLDDKKRSTGDPYIQEKLATKHRELGDLYFQCERVDEALEQYFKGSKLSAGKAEFLLRISECYAKKGDGTRAIRELRALLRDFPDFLQARMKLGVILFNSSLIAEAQEQWEYVLLKDPGNAEAQHYTQLARAAGLTALT